MQAYWLVMQISLAKESAHNMIISKGLPSNLVLMFLVMGLPAHSLGLGCVLQGKGETQKESRLNSLEAPAVGTCCSFNKKLEVDITVKRRHLSTTLKVRGLTVTIGCRREFPQREESAPRPEYGLCLVHSGKREAAHEWS